jgi:hypothetical protein
MIESLSSLLPFYFLPFPFHGCFVMSETFAEHESEDVLSAALSVTDTVKNADGFDELSAAIAQRYAGREEFERAVEIADTINDPYTLDKTLADIAVKCASTVDEAYAFELIESLEDLSHQATAMTRISIAHATRGEFDRATEIASGMEDNSNLLAEIAALSASQGDFERALNIADSLDFPLLRALAHTRIAEGYIKAGHAAEASPLLSQAVQESLEIDTADERAMISAEIALRLADAGDAEQAASVLAKALEDAEIAEEPYRDTALAQIAASHARLKQYDVALEVTEKITDVYVAAETLANLAVIEREAGDREADALQLLNDAHDLLRDDEPSDQKEEAHRWNVFTLVAVRYAEFGAEAQALKAAESIGPEEEKARALLGITQRAVEAGNAEAALRAASTIAGVNYRISALFRISRHLLTADAANEHGLKTLADAVQLIEQVERPAERAVELAEAATLYSLAGRKEQSAKLLHQALTESSSVSSEYEKASALVMISDAYAKSGHELDEEAREMLWQITAV